MTPQILLLLTLAATDILIGVQSLGVFWPVFSLLALPLYRAGRAHATLEADGTRRWLVAVLLFMAISALTNGDSKATSLAYAAMFFAYGFWLTASLSSFRDADTARAMKLVIAAYFGSALAATLVAAMGVKELETFLFTRLWTNTNTGETRPIGFTSEPSYAAFIVVLGWMVLVRMGHIRPGGRNGFGVWTGLTLVALQLFESIYGYLLSIVVLLTSLSLLPRAARMRWLAGGAMLALMTFLFVPTGGEDVRSLRILKAVATGDLETWLIEDTSSFFRFGPLFGYVISANFGEAATWFGHGATSASFFFVDMFREHIDANNDAVELGLLPSYIYDYGLIAGALLMGFLYRTTRGPLRPAMVAILTLLIFNANFSTQMMWFAVTCALLSRRPANDSTLPLE